MLARLTDHVNIEMGYASMFAAYIDRNPKTAYDIEHVLPDDYPSYTQFFNDEEDFKNNRRKVGNLILLISDHNRSYAMILTAPELDGRDKTMPDEKIYRVRTKEGAHINEKLREDGTRAAIQFDEENVLQGPVDLIEVDRSELVEERVVYVEPEQQKRGFGQVIMEDAVAPAVADALTIILTRAADAGIDAFESWMSRKVIPAAKAKGGELIHKAKKSHAAKKTAKSRQRETAIATKKKNNVTAAPVQVEREPVVHTQEEVDQILNGMRYAALYIAAGIRELSKTVIADDGSDPERTLAMQEKLKEFHRDRQ